MNYNNLGATGIKVSRLCFGSLTIGPLQKNKTLAESKPILEAALDAGINFFDTADLYNCYGYLHQALQIKKDLVICTKSYDYTAEGVAKSLDRALRELGRDYVDIYMLHEQESRKTFEGHWEAIEYLLKMKEKGVIRAFGISTHRVEGVRDAADFNEIDVVFPLINLTGIGIEDGNRQEMEVAIEKAKKAGKGVFGMKPLGGGNLLSNKAACFEYILSLKTLDSIAFGMQSVDEVNYNVAKINGDLIEEALEERVNAAPKELHISDWCVGCGTCVEHCNQNALKIVNGMAQVDQKKCLTCCYCAAYCPLFCIKVI
ncbi:MAG: aldo/keto reductase [Eubacterium sp.]